MRGIGFHLKLFLLLTASFVAWCQLAAQSYPPETGGEARMLVTVEAHHGHDMPVINRDDVMVYEGHDRDKVTGWVPAQNESGALEFFVLLDDSSSTDLGEQFEDLRKFINAQPDSVKIGVAYMQNGVARIVQALTSDHTQAAVALRLPMGVGGVNGSPYFALSDLIKRWPQSAARREVLMVTDGIDRYYGSNDINDPYVTSAIEDAQRAKIMVFAIYMPSAGHYGHSYWRTYGGQIQLSRLADETGGESYYIGFNGPPVNIAPYLDDVSFRLGHQYLLTFIPKQQKKSGFQKVKVSTEVPNAELVSASSVYVRSLK